MARVKAFLKSKKTVTIVWVIGIIVIWEVFAIIVENTKRTPINVLPHLYQIIGSFFSDAKVSGQLTMSQLIGQSCRETLLRAGLGFVIGTLIGFALALLMNLSRAVEKIAFPYLMIIQMIPILGMAPIILAITKDINSSRIVIAAILTFYPVSTNVLAGFKAVEREKRELMYSYAANKFQLYTKTLIPACIPYLFTGLKISAPMAITASILVDTLQGGNGLGCMLSQSLKGGMTRLVFWNIVLISAAIGIDDVANMYATLPGTDPDAKRIVMESHCDSVKNGGNYDGILGVMSAMEVLETVASEKIPHKHPLTAMIWTNEEGSLYPPAMMCSGIVCYDYLPEDIRSKFKYEDMMKSKSILDSTKTFGEALDKSGFKGDKKFRISPEKYLYMFETHIEQGSILEDAGNDIGVVDCVLGMFNYRLKFYGQTTHAGTFPMPKRKDAFFAASQALVYLHEEIDKLGYSDLVYTTGEVVCHPCVHTCVPDFFDFSFDARHEDPKVLEKVLAIVKSCADKTWAGCTCEVTKAWNRDTVYWDKKLVGYVKSAAEELGVKHQYIHSGAGHDAQFAAYMLPTTMIFVQSKDGLSHCEPEFSSVEHCAEGASVMLNAVLKADAE